jgi:hypothetical protein
MNNALKMKEICRSETSALTTAIERHIPGTGFFREWAELTWVGIEASSGLLDTG